MYRKKFGKTPPGRWSETDLVRVIESSKKTKQNIPLPQESKSESSVTFSNYPLHEQLQKNLKHLNYVNPTPVQELAIPKVLEGRDLIGVANTGTGKTAAYLVPLINKVLSDRTQKVLIVTPTRELAEQILKNFREISAYTNIASALLIGGNSIVRQIYELRRNPNFVVATPGRLGDLIDRRAIDLSLFNNVVLDETDRMVDIGFLNEIKWFISMLPPKRQSLFFSATVSKKVQDIISLLVKDPVTVDVKKSDSIPNIKQEQVKVSRKQNKVDALHDLLINKDFTKVIVFGNTIKCVESLSLELVERGFKADSIHGDKRQSQRRNVLEKFKSDRINILLATDVAARGLDINDVSHVINYELPQSYEDYIHRIGRTGRSNKSGVALTFTSSNSN